MRQRLLQSIATTISDYRHGEIAAPTAEHVDRWIRQFEPAVQEPMLAEMDHVLRQSYLSRDYFLSFLRGLAARNTLPGGRAWWQALFAVTAGIVRNATGGQRGKRQSSSLWDNVELLTIQKHGASQHDMACLLRDALGTAGTTEASCRGLARSRFVYLDDVLFTGNRVIADLVPWIQTTAPRQADLVIVVIAVYRRGYWYTHKKIQQTASSADKRIRLHWLCAVEYEDRRFIPGGREGFHPNMLPEMRMARDYAMSEAEAGWVPRLRVPTADRPCRLFTSEAGRQLLEQQLLIAGLRIRSICRNPQEILRPLGYDVFHGLGFGATVVTYRNCPNNCPLAWWWGDPDAPRSHPLSRWYPLFPRKV